MIIDFYDDVFKTAAIVGLTPFLSTVNSDYAFNITPVLLEEFDPELASAILHNTEIAKTKNDENIDK